MGSWPYCEKCGKEHPNCKCAGAYAKEAYAEGGEVAPGIESSIDAEMAQGAPAPQANDLIPYAAGSDSHIESSIDNQIKQEKYGTTGQKVKTALEGAASSATLGLSTGIERAMGVDPEDIRGRREVNPLTHGIGQVGGLAATALIPGLGEETAAKVALEAGEGLAGKEAAAAVASKFNPLSAQSVMARAGELAAKHLGPAGETIAANMANTGIKAATEAALFQGGDEVSKMLSGDPNQSIQSAITNVGLTSLLGGGAGVAIGSVSPLWKAAGETKVGEFINDFKNRIGEYLAPEGAAKAESQIITEPAKAPMAAAEQKEFFDPFTKQNVKMPATEAPAASETREVFDPFTKKVVKPGSEPIEAPDVTEEQVSEPETEKTKLTPGEKLADLLIKKGVLGKLTSEGMAGAIGGFIGHAAGIGGPMGILIGSHSLTPFIDSIMPALIKPILAAPAYAAGLKGATSYSMNVVRGIYLSTKAAASIFDKAAETMPQKLVATKEQTEKLDQKVKELDKEPQKMLESGNVVAHYLPDHATSLGKTASNAVNYLNSQRPQPFKPSPLDKEIPPTKAQMAAYNRTLEIAQQPLTVMQHLKDGTINSKDVQDLHVMYPELYAGLRAKIYSAMISHVSKEGKIPYSTRMGVSMFLGSPIDATFAPEAIQAIQATFLRAAGAPQPGQAQMAKHSTAPLSKMSTLAETPAQSRQRTE